MTNRNNIIDGSQAPGRKYGLIYTKNCGWIDLGHAWPSGASELWKKITNGNKSKEDYIVTYSQKMGNKHFKIGIIKKYIIKSQLTLKEMKSVALAIFIDVSYQFESFQGQAIPRLLTNSSFSAEDLFSNIISFYRAVEPSKNYIALCEPVSKAKAFEIWDKYGAVENNKNFYYTPYIYPLENLQPDGAKGPMCAQLPWFLNTIKPAKKGILFREVK